MTTASTPTPATSPATHLDDQELGLQWVIAALQQQFSPPLTTAVVAHAVREAAADLEASARVDHYLPLLAERIAREWLSRAALVSGPAVTLDASLDEGCLRAD
jgi:hypothetical protein